MRWVKLVLYLGLIYVVLAIAMPRAGVWARLVLGPAGWVPDLPHPLIWAVLTAGAGVFLVGLVADVGLALWKVPRWANMLFLGIFGLTLAFYRAEQSQVLGSWTAVSKVHPSVRLSADLGRLQQALGTHFRSHGRFPDEAEVLAALLAGPDGEIPAAPYLYAGLKQRRIGVQVYADATGPVESVPGDALPGTLLYAVSSRRDAYWLTAVAGEGVPAEPRLLEGSDGRPAVISNVPFRRGGR